MHERYQVTSTRLHVVELERSRVLDEDVAWYVIVAAATGTALMALSVEQAPAFAESLRHAEQLIDGNVGSTPDPVVYRSGSFVVRAVPWIGAGLVFASCGHPRGTKLRMQFHLAELEPLAEGIFQACELAHDLAHGSIPSTFPAEWVA